MPNPEVIQWGNTKLEHYIPAGAPFFLIVGPASASTAVFGTGVVGIAIIVVRLGVGLGSQF